MKFRLPVLMCLLIAAVPSVAREKSDVLVMTNGDRLNCAIKALSQDTL